MKESRKELMWIFMLILAFHITSVHAQAFENPEVLRILSVGISGQSSLSAVDLLSGIKEERQKTPVKTTVTTDEGRRLTLIPGPNLCEEDTTRESFTTALLLSSPGPHAVLIHLSLEDQPPEQCDLIQQAQELLGAEVLQYCIVLLQQHRTGASRETAGQMIRACGGRFHIMTNSQTALLAEIDKLVWLNGGKFHSPLNKTHHLKLERQELLKRLNEIDGKLGENHTLFATSGTLGAVGWSLIISLTAVVLVTQCNPNIVIFEATLAGLVAFMASVRNALNPHIACTLNLALCATVAAAFIKYLPIMRQLRNEGRVGTEFFFTVGLGVTLGTVTSIKTFSDVFLASFAALGVAVGAFVFLQVSFKLKEVNIREILVLFMLCSVCAEISMLFVIVLKALFGVTLTVFLLIITTVVAFKSLDPSVQVYVIDILPPVVFFPCACVLTGSFVLILDILLGFLQACTEYLLGSYMFYIALLIGSLILVENPRS